MKALFVRKDSIYKALLGEESCYDKARDASTYAGNDVIIAHPPCRSWGALWWSAKPEIGEPELAIKATNQTIKNGGVLEHPVGSMLFRVMRYQMCTNGFILKVNQFNWGHLSLKPTYLFISGCEKSQLPQIPKAKSTPKYIIGRKKGCNKMCVPTNDREKTPVAFAKWLISVCRIIEFNKKNGIAWKNPTLF